MKPTKEFIKALYNVADKIEFGTEYNWRYPATCNCGLLAQEFGCSVDQIEREIKGLWSDFSNHKRHIITRLPLLSVIRTLYKAGMKNLKDFNIIEFKLTDCKINTLENRIKTASNFRKLANELF